MPRAPVPRSCAKLVGGDNPPGSCGLYVQLRPVGLRKGANLFLNVVFAPYRRNRAHISYINSNRAPAPVRCADRVRPSPRAGADCRAAAGPTGAVRGVVSRCTLAC